MTRTQVQLTDEQMQRLRELAERQGRSVAEVIRKSVDSYIAREQEDREALWERAIAAIGKFPGPADLAIHHDEYFVRGIEEEIEENRR
jgi:predicted transcriptional regulator